MAINSVTADRRAQNNNLYAGIGAAVAGTAGALGGSYMAPKAAKTLDDLVFGDADVFDKSVNKMRILVLLMKQCKQLSRQEHLKIL